MSVTTVTRCRQRVNIYIDNNKANEMLLHKIPLERIDKNSDVPAIKFLGIYIDPSLNFQFHIKHICSKLSKSMFAIRSVKHILPAEALKTLYFSLIHKTSLLISNFLLCLISNMELCSFCSSRQL